MAATKHAQFLLTNPIAIARANNSSNAPPSTCNWFLNKVTVKRSFFKKIRYGLFQRKTLRAYKSLNASEFAAHTFLSSKSYPDHPFCIYKCPRPVQFVFDKTFQFLVGPQRVVVALFRKLSRDFLANVTDTISALQIDVVVKRLRTLIVGVLLMKSIVQNGSLAFQRHNSWFTAK